MKRSGRSLVLIGVLGLLFFWLTDPRWGIVGRGGANAIDEANNARVSTAVGIVGSGMALAIGLYQIARRPV